MSDKHYNDQEEYRYSEDEQSAEVETRDNEQQHSSTNIGSSIDSSENRGGDHDPSNRDRVASKPSLDALLRRLKDLPFLKSKRSIIIIVVILVLFLLMKIVGGDSNPSFPKRDAVVQTQEASRSAPASVKNSQNSIMMTQLRDAVSQGQQNKRNLSTVNRNVQQIQQSFQAMNNVLVQLTDEMTSLNKKIQQIGVKPQVINTDSSIRGAARADSKLKVYHITAMVPGRAWIKNIDDHHIMTVRIGDEVPSYGKISMIDSDNGVIATTSNRVIQFGQNDS
jgi:predicted PurR-regulated permease PerM